MLKDKIVFISGASNGIGKESAISFAKEGSNLIICSRTKEKLDNLKKTLKKPMELKYWHWNLM